MAEREERRFAEVSRDSVKLVAESAGVELADEVAALLAEDVCYRLREATQVSLLLKATIESFNLSQPSYKNIPWLRCAVAKKCGVFTMNVSVTCQRRVVLDHHRVALSS